jgi:hypothetical protein
VDKGAEGIWDEISDRRFALDILKIITISVVLNMKKYPKKTQEDMINKSR